MDSKRKAGNMVTLSICCHKIPPKTNSSHTALRAPEAAGKRESLFEIFPAIWGPLHMPVHFEESFLLLPAKGVFVILNIMVS